MIRRLAALVASPLVKGALGVAVVGMGVKLLTDLVTELRAQVDDLNAEVLQLQARREAEAVALLELARQRRGAPYPSAGDLDPLGHGALVDDGDPDPAAALAEQLD